MALPSGRDDVTQRIEPGDLGVCGAVRTESGCPVVLLVLRDERPTEVHVGEVVTAVAGVRLARDLAAGETAVESLGADEQGVYSRAFLKRVEYGVDALVDERDGSDLDSGENAQSLQLLVSYSASRGTRRNRGLFPSSTRATSSTM